MKATKIYYQKCFNLGNYQNEVVGIELEVGDGEKAVDVLEKAKQFVDSKDFLAAGIQEYENSLRIVNSPDEYTGRQVKDAQAFLDKYDTKDDLPFNHNLIRNEENTINMCYSRFDSGMCFAEKI